LDVRETQAAVVCPRIGVDPARTKLLDAKRRNASPRALGRDESAVALTRQRGVGPQSRLDGERVIGAVPVEREKKRLTADEVRCHDLHERAPFPMSLPDEANVAEPQVAEAPVDELRRGAGGLGAEVRPVDEGDGEPGAGRLAGDTGADDAAADHQEVEAPGLQPLERLSSV
jgi:hypothetical protein